MATAIEFGLINSYAQALDKVTFGNITFNSFIVTHVGAVRTIFDSMGRIRPVPRPG